VQVFGEFSKFHAYEFRVYRWGVEVENLPIDGAAACTLCVDNAVEVNLDCDHVDSGGTAIPGISDATATIGEASAIRIGLLRTIVDTHAPVCNFFVLANGDVVSSNEDNFVGALANDWDALGKGTEFNHLGLAPEFFVLGVDDKVAHFHEGHQCWC
jgi:hypothetical protein